MSGDRNRTPFNDEPCLFLRRFLRPSGPGSIKAALEADRTLGGLVDALVVAKRFGYGVYDVGGIDYLGARFTVRVWGRG